MVHDRRVAGGGILALALAEGFEGFAFSGAAFGSGWHSYPFLIRK
jgi:hypothetical protein